MGQNGISHGSVGTILKDGGELVLEMGSRPNYQWGADPSAAPPSGLAKE